MDSRRSDASKVIHSNELAIAAIFATLPRRMQIQSELYSPRKRDLPGDGINIQRDGVKSIAHLPFR